MIRAYRTKDTFLNQTATHHLAVLGLLADSFLQALSVQLPVPPADPLNGMIDRRSPSAATHLLGGDGESRRHHLGFRSPARETQPFHLLKQCDV